MPWGGEAFLPVEKEEVGCALSDRWGLLNLKMGCALGRGRFNLLHCSDELPQAVCGCDVAPREKDAHHVRLLDVRLEEGDRLEIVHVEEGLSGK